MAKKKKEAGDKGRLDVAQRIYDPRSWYYTICFESFGGWVLWNGMKSSK